MVQIGRKNKGKAKKSGIRNNQRVGVSPGNPQGQNICALEDRLRQSTCWGEMLDMLAIGTRVADIVHFAKEEKKAYPTMTAETLERYLHWFVEKRGKDYILNRCPSKLKMYESAMYDFDVFVAHKMLAAIQFERVTSAVEREKEAGELSSSTSKQIELLNTILKTVNDEEIQRNTKRVSERFIRQIGDNNGSSVLMAVEKVKEQYSQRYGANTAKVILDPESRRRLLNVIERVRASASGPVRKVLEAEMQKESEFDNLSDGEVIEHDASEVSKE
jgi:hypothetical protein